MKAVKEINFLSHIFQKTVFHRERTVFWIWMSSGLIYAIVKLLIGKYNNYKIFENVFPHVINGLPLYVEYPTEYYDVNHYGPIFALVIAPFSILPVGDDFLDFNEYIFSFLCYSSVTFQ